MTTLFFGAAFAAGLATVGWVGAGYASGHILALLVTVAIAGFYALGAWELRRHRLETAALGQAVQALTQTPSSLDAWLQTLPAGLRVAVRQRVEGARNALPGPALASYLTGLLVLLGMLGTFLGMVVTLDGTGSALLGAQGLHAIRDALSAPVRGLGLAFGTSVAGVGASAALGLMAALARRERVAVAQHLDAQIATTLRPLTPQHQRDLQLQLLQDQAHMMPTLVERISACMQALEQQQQAMGERMVSEQTRFHEGTHAAYTQLATRVEQALTSSAAEGARQAGAAIAPAIEAALAGLARESAQLQASQAQQVRTQLEGMSAQLGQATSAVADQWSRALQTHQHTSETVTQQLREALGQFNDQWAQRSQALSHDLHQHMAQQAQSLSAQWQTVLEQQASTAAQWASQHWQAMQAAAEAWAQRTEQLQAQLESAQAAQQARLEARDEARLAQWSAALQGVTQGVHAQWQATSDATAQQWQQLAQALEATGQTLAAQTQAQTQQLLERLQAQQAQDDARMTRWAQAMEAASQAQQAQWHQMTQQLGDTGAQWQAHSQAQVQAVLARLDEKALNDAQRHEAWTQALQTLGHTLRDEWQQAGHALHADRHTQVQALLGRMEEKAAQDSERHANWMQAMQALGQTLRDEWQQAGHALHADRHEQVQALVARIEEKAQLDAQRQAAWTDALQSLGHTLREEWQQAGRALQAEQQTQVQALLAGLEARALQDAQRHEGWTDSLERLTATLREEWLQAGQALQADQHAQVQALLAQIEARGQQDAQRHEGWTQALQGLSSTLRHDWQQASTDAAAQWQGLGDTLQTTATGITQALSTHAQSTLQEIATLVAAASEAPRAAAEVIGELRQKLEDSMAHDNAMLEERGRVLQTVSTLLDAVNHASEQQRTAVDALVSTTQTLMEQASAQFAQTLQAQGDKMEGVTHQLTSSAVEVAALGESFEVGVQRFGEVNEQLMAQLQRIEASLGQSMARSDEQLEYYVAQAREVVELSVGAQKQIIDGLQQVAEAVAAQRSAEPA